MPLYMDVHNHIEGLTADAVAGAHLRDLAVQDKHGVKFHRYWFDVANGKVFCLVEAPSAADVIAAHKEAHGLLPEALDEVTEGR